MGKLVAFAPEGVDFPGYISHLEIGGERYQLDKPLTFSYRPATAIDANKKFDEVAKSTEFKGLGENEKEATATVRFVASRLKWWDRDCPVTENTVRSAIGPMLNRLNAIIQGLDVSDDRPDGETIETPEGAAGNS